MPPSATVLDEPAAPPSQEVPDPRKPGEIRWTRVLLGWLLGLGATSVVAFLVAAADTTLRNWVATGLPGLVSVLAVPVALGALAAWLIRRRMKGLAVGVILFAATALVAGVALVWLLLANWGC